MARSPTACVVIIGNEILNGKVTDANTPFFIEQLRGLGVRLARVVFVEDDVETIAAEVRAASAGFDWVFTSGGLGPTHDDLTLAGVARAFDCEVVQSAELLARLDGIRGGRSVEALSRLTWIPARASLFWGQEDLWGEEDGRLRWPIVYVDNVWVFPGVPAFLRSMFVRLHPRLSALPFVCGAVDCGQTETDLVDAIDATDRAFAAVELGSYPQFGDDRDHKTRLTFDGLDPVEVNAAMDHFLGALDPRAVVRVTRPK